MDGRGPLSEVFAGSSLGDALAWLDAHQNLERMLAGHRATPPDLSRMTRMVDLLGQPQRAMPILHLTGTNGKTSSARALCELLMAKGLTVGTYTSPHLETVNERMTFNGDPIGDEELFEALAGIASLEPLLGEGIRLTWFEVLTAAAFRWFADRPVDVAVVEVGLGGRWDATNVADAAVAVVTNVGLDHTELLGPTRADVAREKSGIVKAGSTLVLGERDPDLLPIFETAQPESLWLAGRDYGCERNDMAVGGRILDLHTPGARYGDVFLDLHGSYQGDNFAGALAAAEAFFGAPLDEALVRQAAASVRSPGRMEVVRQRPTVVLDGAKNPDGARRAAAAFDEELAAAASRILVVGMLGGKDPLEMLEALDVTRFRLVVACPPPSPRAQPAAEVAQAAAKLGAVARTASSVSEAVDVALAEASSDEVILVSGSLYVVGEARAHLATDRVGRGRA